MSGRKDCKYYIENKSSNFTCKLAHRTGDCPSNCVKYVEKGNNISYWDCEHYNPCDDYFADKILPCTKHKIIRRECPYTIDEVEPFDYGETCEDYKIPYYKLINCLTPKINETCGENMNDSKLVSKMEERIRTIEQIHEENIKEDIKKILKQDMHGINGVNVSKQLIKKAYALRLLEDEKTTLIHQLAYLKE